MGIDQLIAYLLAQGAVISFAVDFLKRIAFVAAHPKIVAAVFNAFATIAAAYLTVGLGLDITKFLAAIAAAFAGSVAFYEVKKSVKPS